jgi:hypothetical protein
MQCAPVSCSWDVQIISTCAVENAVEAKHDSQEGMKDYDD